MHRNLMAIRSGAKQDGFVFCVKALTPGFEKIKDCRAIDHSLGDAQAGGRPDRICGGRTGECEKQCQRGPTWRPGRRWRGLASFIRDSVGSFDPSCGMSAEEPDEILLRESLALPAAIREWYLLAARWSQGALNVWIGPQELAAEDGMVEVLTDTQGANRWGVRAADHDIEDPAVYDLDTKPTQIDFQSFTSLVAAMIVNDVIFSSDTDGPVELNPGVARAGLTCFVSIAVGTCTPTRFSTLRPSSCSPTPGMARRTAKRELPQGIHCFSGSNYKSGPIPALGL